MSAKPTASISELTFSGDDCFQLTSNEKIIIVGSNNSGKSQSLREIVSISKTAKTDHTLVIKGLKITKNGSVDQLKEFFNEKGELVNDSYRYKSWQIPVSQIDFWSSSYLPHGLLNGFIKIITANNRLNVCAQQSSISAGQQKTMPQHILYDDELLMKKISSLFKQAFGKNLMFDFRGGSKLPIHVGNMQNTGEIVDRVSNEYVNMIRQHPLLDLQGDGMKSYAGILFEAIVSDLDITLIDEPEAFLHPPQMRKLGETLASEVEGQLIVATHSSDILRGFLEGTKGNIRILRIRREGDKNIVSEAPGEAIKELWEKPDLRYSNALEGVFHEQTIICEDDSDCRLINSIADYLSNSSEEQWKDTAYVPTGGKHAVPKIAKVLRQIGVPIKAVFDIDFLSESSLVESTVTAFGGNWEEIKPFWGRVDSAVRGGIKPKSTPEIKAEIISIVDSSESNNLPKGDIIEAMKQGNSWNIIKKFGVRGIPSGQAQTDYNMLKKYLESIGIYLVPVGELEGFCQKIGLHGPRFVTKLLSSIPLNDSCLNDLRLFVKTIHKGSHCNFN